MIIAKLSYDGRQDRYVQLNEGAHVFGTDFDCDVVLIEEFIQPQHFILECDASSTKLRILDGASATLHSGFVGELELDAGSETTWHFSDKLTIDGLTIQLSGEALSGPEPEEKEVANVAWFPQVLNRTVRGAVVLAGVGMICGMGYMVMSRGLAGPVEARVPAPDTEIGQQIMAVVPAPEPHDVAAMLTEAGFAPDYVRKTPSGLAAAFYVPSVSKRAELQIFLADFEHRIEPRIYLDSSLLSAANMALEMSSMDIGSHSVKNGVLIIEDAPSDPEWRNEIQLLVKTDVPGLKSVEFSGRDIAWQTELGEMIAGAWAGPYPYVVLADGRDVRIGQELMPNIALLSVESPDTLLLQINGTSEEYKLP